MLKIAVLVSGGGTNLPALLDAQTAGRNPHGERALVGSHTAGAYARARAKGAGEGRVVMHHALRNAMIPVITVIGLQIGTLLGGAVVNETVFSLPGLGTLMINAINQKNEPVVLGCLITFAIMFSLVNLLIDILYAFIDPRIKSQYK